MGQHEQEYTLHAGLHTPMHEVCEGHAMIFYTALKRIILPSLFWTHLCGEGQNIVKRITDIQQLPTDNKAHLFDLMDAFLRDHKAKEA